jgi:hypothetical protein
MKKGRLKKAKMYGGRKKLDKEARETTHRTGKRGKKRR